MSGVIKVGTEQLDQANNFDVFNNAENPKKINFNYKLINSSYLKYV